jgi:hypothetical protein
MAARIDAALCVLALACACVLPWRLGRYPPFWSIDARGAHMILLLCALAAAASWGERRAAPVWASRLLVLGGTVAAIAAAGPLGSWLGMAFAALGATAAGLPRRAEAWRRLGLTCAGLGLALFGAVAFPATLAPAAAGILALGYGLLALLAPELAVAAVALILRADAAVGAQLFLAAGLAALLIAAIGLSRRTTLNLVDLAQSGVALFAFGLGTAAGDLAGLLQLSLLALTRCAVLLARQDGLDRLAAVAGLAGLPPFGLFASLALILAATATRAAWLVLPLGIGLAAVVWALLPRLPTGRRLLPSPAWLPLVLALLCGFAMPAPLLAWFRLAAR